MSAWSEAVYIVKEMRRALISEETLEKLKNRRSIIDNAIVEDEKYYPEHYVADTYTDNSLWLVTEKEEENFVLAVIDSKTTIDGKIVPTHESDIDNYLLNSVWLITDN